MSNKKYIFLAQAILGITFLFSAISKLISPGIFEITIIEQGIVTSRITASYLARLLFSFELFLGLALFQPYYLKKLVIPLSLFTLIGFTFYLLFFVIVAPTNNCGCFGEVIKMSPLQAILKNILLFIIGLFVYRSTKENRTHPLIPLVLLTVSIITVFWAAPIRAFDDLTFAKYSNFKNAGIVDLLEGEKFVAIFYIDCEHCIETGKEIVSFENKNHKIDNLYILFAGEESDSIQYFLKETKIEHPYLRIPIDDFFDLIGNAPPRVYKLDNGKIVKFWDSNFIENLTK